MKRKGEIEAGIQRLIVLLHQSEHDADERNTLCEDAAAAVFMGMRSVLQEMIDGGDWEETFRDHFCYDAISDADSGGDDGGGNVSSDALN